MTGCNFKISTSDANFNIQGFSPRIPKLNQRKTVKLCGSIESVVTVDIGLKHFKNRVSASLFY